MRIRIKAIVAVVSLLSIIAVSNVSHVVLANAHVHSDDCYTNGVTQHFHDNKSDCHSWNRYPGPPCIRCYTEGGHGYYPCPDCDGKGHKGVICTGTYRLAYESDHNWRYCSEHVGKCKNVSSKELHVVCDVCGMEEDGIYISTCERGVIDYSAGWPFNVGDVPPIKHRDTDDPYVPCSTCGGSGNSNIICPYCEGDACAVTRPCSVCNGDYENKGVCENCTNGIFTDSSKCRNDITFVSEETTKRTSGNNTIEQGNWYYSMECDNCGVSYDLKYNAKLTYNTSTGNDVSFTGTIYVYRKDSTTVYKSKSHSGNIWSEDLDDLNLHVSGVTCPKCNGTAISDCTSCYKGFVTLYRICSITPGAYNADGTVATSFCNKVVTEINPRK